MIDTTAFDTNHLPESGPEGIYPESHPIHLDDLLEGLEFAVRPKDLISSDATSLWDLMRPGNMELWKMVLVNPSSSFWGLTPASRTSERGVVVRNRWPVFGYT